MKRILASLAALGSLTPWLLFGQPTPPPATSSTSASAEHKLIKLEDKWNDALIKGDPAYLDPLMTDDYMVTYPGGEFENKAQCLADLTTGDLKVTEAVNDQCKVHVYGDAAVLSYRTTVKGTFKGNDISGPYRETATWVKHAGHWQCAAAHLSKMPE